MPILIDDSYRPSLFLKNGHFSTIFPYVVRKNLSFPHSLRERWTTPDDDFIDLDFYKANHKRIALLLHGLEGSSQSQYMRATSHELATNGWDVCALNHRSCSGQMNRRPQMYHSGFTMDINFVVNRLTAIYDYIVIVGFSMGGNMAMKYVGDGHYTLPQQLKSIVAVSVPIELASSSIELSKWKNKIFTKQFLITLMQKMTIKAELFPELLKRENIKKVYNLIDFDNYFTAPLHGFIDGQDYYKRASSKQFLRTITIPTTLINALNDPFLSPECMPFEEALDNSFFNFFPIKHGGHVGFGKMGKSPYWIEKKISEILMV